MASIARPRSILKKPKTSSPSSTTITTAPPPIPAAAPPPPRTKAERDRELALYHAQVIQQRKDIELHILLSTEELIEYPLSACPPYSASRPSSSDTDSLLGSLQLFQPHDYDALVQERNINHKCGYALCSLPNKLETGMHPGQYRIIGKTGRAKDFRVVAKEELERWCSEECARRALYLRVQLSERPAWEREGLEGRLELMGERSADVVKDAELVEDMNKLELEKGIKSRQDRENLALERGESQSRGANGMVGVEVLEKDIVRPPAAPELDNTLDEKLLSVHLTLDGYTPRFGQEEQDFETSAGADWKM